MAENHLLHCLRFSLFESVSIVNMLCKTNCLKRDPFFSSSSVFVCSLSWYREQIEHTLRPGPAVPHPEEALRELRSRHGESGDYQH